jgi:hypothetical protein
VHRVLIETIVIANLLARKPVAHRELAVNDWHACRYEERVGN